jgi:hypothetical protein
MLQLITKRGARTWVFQQVDTSQQIGKGGKKKHTTGYHRTLPAEPPCNECQNNGKCYVQCAKFNAYAK